MTTHHVTEIVPHTPEQIYALVMDIEKYPEFIPWCRAARILQGEGNDFLGELVITFKHIRESYVSRVSGDEETYTIHVEMERGPFHHLVNDWKLMPHPQGCLIDFTIDFAFKNAILQTIIGSLFSRAAKKMVNAFKERADSLYNNIS